jgi:hypothetical protein
MNAARKIIVLLVATLIGCSSSATETAPLAYRSGDRKVSLVEIDDLALVPKQASPLFMASAKRKKPAGTVIELPYLTERTGMMLVKRQPDVSVRDFQLSVSDATGTESRAGHKVYSAGAATVVLTDAFSVEFMDPTDEAAARMLLDPYLDFQFSLTREDLTYQGKLIAQRPNRWVVKITDGTLPEKALPRIDKVLDDPLVDFVSPRFITIRLESLEELREAMRLRAMLDARLEATLKLDKPCNPGLSNPPNDKLFPMQWHLRNTGTMPNVDGVNQGTPAADIDAMGAWSIFQASGFIPQASGDVVIAVLDDGVDSQHPDLDDILEDGFDAVLETDPEPPANKSHGTAAAGVIAAETNNCDGIAGVARGARILPIKVEGVHTGGEMNALYSTEVTVKNGIDFAREWSGDGTEDVDVILMAFHTAEDPDITNAIESAIDDGIVVVAAAGTFTIASPDYVRFPASLAAGSTSALQGGLIAVGATTQQDRIKTAHPTEDSDPDSTFQYAQGSAHGSAVSLAAPGLWVTTTHHSKSGTPYVQDWGGTSAASAIVAGAAALILAKYPTATPAQVKNWLMQGADPGENQQLGLDSRPVWNEYYGAGRLNVQCALLEAKAEMNGTTASACPPRSGP